MNQILTFAPIGLLAVVFFVSLFLVTRGFRKKQADLLDRLMSMDRELDDLKKAGRVDTDGIRRGLQDDIENIRKAMDGLSAANIDEISRKTTQVKEDIRTALKTYIESIIKKIGENDAAQKSMFETLSSQVAELQRKSLDEAPVPASDTPGTGEAMQQPQQAPPMQMSAVPPQKRQAGPSDDEHAKARRLARLIVSDIALYNRKNVERGVREDKFMEVLEQDINEARALYVRRVPEEIRNSTSYLDDAFKELFEKTKQELNL